MRLVAFLFLSVCCSSCTYFSSDKSKTEQALDTIINFNKVDVSPSFLECKDKMEQEKTDCFRATIHRELANKLAEHEIKAKDSINEIVTVNLLITNKGKIEFQEIKSSEVIKQEIPALDSLLQISVVDLPTIFPATKRGIPVATQYSLPIRIQLKE